MAHSDGFLKQVNAAKEMIKETNCDDVFNRLQNGETLQLIDVREDKEWDAGKIKGSVHIGKGVIERDIEKMYPDKSTELILYCGGGFRSAIAAKSLTEMGYTKAISMDGGIKVWREKDYPQE